jgi:hypothetical protein
MPVWPKEKLLKHGPEFPLEERIRRYQHNIRTIREAGCAVPTSALIDSLDPAEIELWFADNGFRIHSLNKAIDGLLGLPPDPEQTSTPPSKGD